MPQFQVQYKYNSKTHTINLTSDSWQKVRDFAQELINGEITEIREFVHQDDTVKKDDGDYVSYSSFFIKDDKDAFSSFKIPKVKKNLTNLQLEDFLKNHIKINSKTPHSVKISSKN